MTTNRETPAGITTFSIRVGICVLFIFATHLSASDQGETDRFFNTLIQKYEIPGLSVAIVEGDRVAYSGSYGVKATDSKEPVNKQTIFSAASLSKPCFAYGVMKLVQAGKLDLDKPLCQYLEYEDIAHDERYKKITARMILSHSSGLPNWRNGKLVLDFEPGAKYQYSGEGFVYLSKVVEHIMAEPLNDFMDDFVFKPLSMMHSSYVWRESFESNFAAPHEFTGEALPKYRPKSENVAASLQTTAEDYAKLLIAVLNSTGLKQSTLDEMLSPQIKVDDSGRLNWGLGWGLQRTDKGKAIWQWGDNGVFKAYVIAYPNQRKGMVFLANSYNGLKIVPEVIKFVFHDTCPAFDMLDYETKYKPDQKLLMGILADGYDKGIKDYLDPTGSHQDTSQIDEGQMNYVGTQLALRKRYEDAEKVLQANIQAYPGSFRVYENYGDFCLSRGDFDRARSYYSKVLELQPDREVIQSCLRHLSPEGQDGNVVFRLPDYNYADLVSVAGSFNNWNKWSLPCMRRNGEWVCRIKLEPGTYRYKFVIDGVWTIDPNNTKVVEDGGYVNSVLVVEKE